MVIDIYDFDKTVFPKDSTAMFWRFCVKKCPWILIDVPFQAILTLLWVTGFISTGTYKSGFMSFVYMIDTEKMVKTFWDKNEDKIYTWFHKENRKNYSVVISASPDYILEEICQRLSVDKLICSKGDKKSGKLLGKNCKGKEKVMRIMKEMDDFFVESVYSDSEKSDRPIFELGKIKIKTVNGERIILEENNECKC